MICPVCGTVMNLTIQDDEFGDRYYTCPQCGKTIPA